MLDSKPKVVKKPLDWPCYNSAMSTEIVLPLETMTVAEKLEVIDAVWQDLRKNEGSLPVPEWHKQILERRRRSFERGEVGYTNWEDAKAEIRRRVS